MTITRIFAIRGYVDTYKYVYLFLIAVNPFVELLTAPKGGWQDFYHWHLLLAVSNIVFWLAYRIGAFTQGGDEGLIATVGFLGERALSLGRIAMCFLGPIGFFPYSPVSGTVWFPLISLATYQYLFPMFVLVVLAMGAAEVNYFIALGKPEFRNP
jgi:hypothetical protein